MTLEQNPSPLRLNSERLILSICGVEHAAAVLDFRRRNREHLRHNLPTLATDYWTIEYWRARLADNLIEAEAGRSLRYFLFLRDDPHRVIGDCALSNIVRGAFQAAYLGYNLDEHCVGKGLMREALEALIAFAFGPLKIHRIMANHRPENVRSAGLLRRLGFVEEGYARDYLYLDGAWRDHVLTALTNHACESP